MASGARRAGRRPAARGGGCGSSGSERRRRRCRARRRCAGGRAMRAPDAWREGVQRAPAPASVREARGGALLGGFGMSTQPGRPARGDLGARGGPLRYVRAAPEAGAARPLGPRTTAARGGGAGSSFALDSGADCDRAVSQRRARQSRPVTADLCTWLRPDADKTAQLPPRTIMYGVLDARTRSVRRSSRDRTARLLQLVLRPNWADPKMVPTLQASCSSRCSASATTTAGRPS